MTPPTPCQSINQAGWLELRAQLWPHCSKAQHLTEMTGFLAAPQRYAQFVQYDRTDQAIGFVEVSLRHDYVNGTQSSPVAYLEGIYVVPAARRQGVARVLIARAEQWAVGAGCTEFASDALLDNTQSHAMHSALGFNESMRVVFFRKNIASSQ
ncbi:MAG: GNAT family N-acetyltransferase [Gammaproteobacteria bacterium]|nr:GNAT family N-acetyltransferase [Gammaproteobacteria bacterium]